MISREDSGEFPFIAVLEVVRLSLDKGLVFTVNPSGITASRDSAALPVRCSSLRPVSRMTVHSELSASGIADKNALQKIYELHKIVSSKRSER